MSCREINENGSHPVEFVIRERVVERQKQNLGKKPPRLAGLVILSAGRGIDDHHTVSLGRVESMQRQLPPQGVGRIGEDWKDPESMGGDMRCWARE